MLQEIVAPIWWISLGLIPLVVAVLIIRQVLIKHGLITPSGGAGLIAAVTTKPWILVLIGIIMATWLGFRSVGILVKYTGMNYRLAMIFATFIGIPIITAFVFVIVGDAMRPSKVRQTGAAIFFTAMAAVFASWYWQKPIPSLADWRTGKSLVWVLTDEKGNIIEYRFVPEDHDKNQEIYSELRVGAKLHEANRIESEKLAEMLSKNDQIGKVVSILSPSPTPIPTPPPPPKEEWVIDHVRAENPHRVLIGQTVTNVNISENEISGVWHCLVGLVPFSLKSRDGKTYKGLVNGTDNLTLFKINDYRYEGHWYDNENGSGTIVLRKK